MDGIVTNVPQDGTTVDVTTEYGTLTIDMNGDYSYTVNNSLDEVDAMKDGDMIIDNITYVASNGTQSDEATLNIAINGKTDGTEPDIYPYTDEDNTANVVGSESTTVTIDISNVTNTNLGYSVKAYSNINDLSTEVDVSTVTGTNHDGFGVKGLPESENTNVNPANESEIGYDANDNISEGIVVSFDDDISSIDVSFGWIHSYDSGDGDGEHALIEFYKDGVKVGDSIDFYKSSFTDTVDGPFTFETTNGESFDEVRFSTIGEGDDYLINSLTYTTISNAADAECDVVIAKEEGHEWVGVDNNTHTTNSPVEGIIASGNILSNDENVTSITEVTINGVTTAIPQDGSAVSINTAYGTITISSNGDYTYQVDDTNTTVDEMNIGDYIVDKIEYVSSNGIDSDDAAVGIIIKGTDDAPIIESISGNDQPIHTVNGLLDIDGDGNGDVVSPNDLLDRNGTPVFPTNNGNIEIDMGDGSSSLSIDYFGGNASYTNAFGYYTVDENGNYEAHIIYTDTGDMDGDGSNYDKFLDGINLGTLTNLSGEIGFFIIPNGTSLGITTSSSVTYDDVNGWQVDGNSVNAYATDNDLSTDGKDHAVMTVNPDGGLTIGFEDQSIGDKDYDDFVITIYPCETLGSATQTVLLEEDFEGITKDCKDSNFNKDWYVDHGTYGDDVLVSDDQNEWQMNDSGVEVRVDGGVHGLETANDSDTYIELDSHTKGVNSSITTEVDLGDSNDGFTLTFDYAPRPGNENSSDMQFTFAGYTVSINVDSAGNVTIDAPSGVEASIEPNGDWYSITATYSNVTGDSATLSFESTGNADTFGAYMDNIKLVGTDYSNENTILTDISLSDVDDTNLESATITLTNYQVGDVINTTGLPSGITIASNSVDGNGNLVVELTGTATKADYELALESLTFESSSENRTPRELEFVVFDGDKYSNTMEVTIDIGGCELNTYSKAVLNIVGPETVMEGDDAEGYKVTIDEAPETDLIVTVVTGHITTQDGDYIALTKDVTIKAGETSSEEFSVTTNNDTDADSGEKYSVSITSTSGGGFDKVEIGVGSVTTTILDNDSNLSIADTAAVVSEEGLDDGIKDDYQEASDYTGVDYTDVTDSSSYSGNINITTNGTNENTIEIDLSSLPTNLSSNSETIVWSYDISSGSENKAVAIGSNSEGEVIRVELNSGNTTVNTQGTSAPSTVSYEVTISQPLDHPVNSTEDTVSFDFDVTLSDGVYTPATGTISVTIEDDMPTSSDASIEINVSSQPVNLVFTLDISGSMGQSGDRLSKAIEAIEDLVAEYESQGKEVYTQLNTFSTTAQTPVSGWLDSETLSTELAKLSSGGYTNYEAALEQTEENYTTPTNGGNTYVYFLSDGVPTVELEDRTSNPDDTTYGYRQDCIDGVTYNTGYLDANRLEAWEDFISDSANNIANVYAIGIDMDSDTYLKLISSNASVVDSDNLSANLIGTVVNETGSLDFSFGADGPADDLAFTWETPVVTGDDSSSISWNIIGGTLLVGTIAGEVVIKVEATDIDTDNPQYKITNLDSGIDIDNISIPYKVTDGDGDSVTSTLDITVNTPTIIEDTNVILCEDNVYTFTMNDFDNDATSIRIESLPLLGVLKIDGVEVESSDLPLEISKSDIEGGKLTFTPDINDSGRDEYNTTGLGDQESDYARFEFTSSDGSSWSSSSTVTIDVSPVADAPTLDIEGTITTTTTIDITNVNDTTGGYSVKAYDINGNETSVSIVTNTSHNGIGVDGTTYGGANQGDENEIGYDTNSSKSESLVVNFDNEVTSVDISFAWKHGYDYSSYSGETAVIEFYKDGVKVGESITHNGGTDTVDGPYTFQTTTGEEFDEIRFSSYGEGDDYLIHEITYNEVVTSESELTTQAGETIELNISSALTDLDGSESLARLVIDNLPEGTIISDGTNEFTSSGTNDSVDVLSWNLSSISLTLPSGIDEGSYELSIKSTSEESLKDQLDGTVACPLEADTEKTFTIIVEEVTNPNANTPIADIEVEYSKTITTNEVCTTGQDLGGIVDYLNNGSSAVNASTIIDLIEDQNGNTANVSQYTDPKYDDNLEFIHEGENDLLMHKDASYCGKQVIDIEDIDLKDSATYTGATATVIDSDDFMNSYKMSDNNTTEVIVKNGLGVNDAIEGTSGNDIVIIDGDMGEGTGTKVIPGDGNDLIAILGDIHGGYVNADGGTDILYLGKDASHYEIVWINFHEDFDGQIKDLDTGKILGFNNIEGIAFGDGSGINCNTTSTTTYQYIVSISAALADVSADETLSVVISGVPTGATLSSEVYTLVDNGDGTWTVTVPNSDTSISDDNIIMEVPSDTGDFNISVTATATTTDGTTAEFTDIEAVSDDIDADESISRIFDITSDITTGSGEDEISAGDDIRYYADINTGAGDDTINVGDDIKYHANINTGAGDDIINVGDDIKDNVKIDTGSGDDIINLGDEITDSAHIDMGNGYDTLSLDDEDTIDLADIAQRVDNIEVIDLDNGEDQHLKLDLDDIVDITDSDNDLVIKGNDGDSIEFNDSDTWNKATTTTQIDGEDGEFYEYTSSTNPNISIFIEDQIDTDL
ncbi:VCBS domain-containing protein [Halarcobacter sp.]|uniref:VCBS domain-containing protein n=1 Tax=Halarcobacter sp. TaxID=2321133 RepID=UPI002AAB897E|nr:VCBS domain-containing protein [Halarcobacter sp.]